ncbi:MAG: helix-turn-helix domain-containing protein [Beijerinckiaceae bacterium]
MSPAEREESIVQGAISFFADVGFDGQTRELASRLGITQPLIFRYFPTKDDLIERIYQRLYVGRWNPEWRKMIGDRETPLAARLTRMYRIYVTEVLTSEWVRIFLYSGLKGSLFNRRYIDLIGKQLIEPICLEIEHDNPGVDLTRRQLRDLVWGLHGSIFYIGVRKWVYDVDVGDEQATVSLLVGRFLQDLSVREQ